MAAAERITYAQAFDELPVSYKVAIGRQLCEAMDSGGRIPPGLTRTVLVGIVRSVRVDAGVIPK